ncbi:MAG: hypothetical protein JST28_14580 [Acidobacteria bacterium]|nr:hypothetical protein [Acidobacteriota bacterium]
MEDLFIALLGFVVELLGETLTDLAFAAIVDVVSRAFRSVGSSAREGDPVASTVVLIAAGAVLGFLSGVIFPHPLVHPSKYHGISLLISPLITGLIMAVVGRGIRRRGRVPVRIESFAYGFSFAFTFALIRILMVR